MRDWLRRSAELSTGAVGLRCAGRMMTFGELDQDVDRVCAGLAGVGVRQGDWVGVLGHTSIDLVLILFGLWRFGAVSVPVNIRWSEAEVVRVARGYGVARWLVDHSNRWLEGERLDLVHDYTKLINQNATTDPRKVATAAHHRDDVCCALFTSGTSGTPKAVQITHANLLHNAALTSIRLGIRPNDHWLCCLPLFHVGGLAMLYRAIITGTTISLHERFDVEAVNDAINHNGVTHVSLVPTMLSRLLDARTTPPPHPVTVLLGGAAAPAALITRARQANFDVLSTYGLTESTSQAATQAPAAAGVKIGSAGRSVPFVTVTVRGADGMERPAGEIGDIYVKGPTIMKGYANDPAANGAAITPYGLRTGDLGYLDADGDLWIVNRRTDLIVSGGENIYPAEVEAALMQITGITAACVVAVDDPEWGQIPAAAVISERPVALAELRAALNPLLARYKHPKRLLRVNTLPLLANGKVDRRAVASMFKNGPDH